MKIIETKTVTMAESLGQLTKEDEDSLGYEQKITVDYLRRHTLLSEKDVIITRKELEQIEGLKEHQITALLDMVPETEEDVKILFMKERVSVEKDQIKKILEALDKVRPDKKKIKARHVAFRKEREAALAKEIEEEAVEVVESEEKTEKK